MVPASRMPWCKPRCRISLATRTGALLATRLTSVLASMLQAGRHCAAAHACGAAVAVKVTVERRFGNDRHCRFFASLHVDAAALGGRHFGEPEDLSRETEPQYDFAPVRCQAEKFEPPAQQDIGAAFQLFADAEYELPAPERTAFRELQQSFAVAGRQLAGENLSMQCSGFAAPGVPIVRCGIVILTTNCRRGDRPAGVLLALMQRIK